MRKLATNLIAAALCALTLSAQPSALRLLDTAPGRGIMRDR